MRLLADAAVRPPLRAGAPPRDLHRAARGAPSRRGGKAPRAGRGIELGDPARRARPPEPAEVDAARLPRREDAAAVRADAARWPSARSARWPQDEPIALHPRLQALTLEIILRAVFGLDAGERLDAMRERLTGILQFGASPASTLPLLQRGRTWREFLEGRDEADAMIYETIDERRANGGDEERDDVLAMLLEARHEDGSPMSPVELRDELMTLLVAGHETTASELAWAFERLTRTPGGARAPHGGGRLERRRLVRHGDGARDAAPPPGAAERRAAARHGAGRGGRLALRARRLPDRGRLPAPSRPGHLSRPVRLPAGALPRRAARHLHMDPVRWRPPPLPRRELRAARDEDRPARGARAERAGARRAARTRERAAAASR